jgi:Ni/Fe-hydrogenase subunit HybB-like protein
MILPDKLQRLKALSTPVGYGPWALLWVVLILIGTIAFATGIRGTGSERTWLIFLVNFLFWSGLAYGSIVISAALVMTKARWGRPLKRLAEAPAAFLPFSLLLFGILFLGRHKIFPWIQKPVPEKALWLKAGFMFARDGFFLLILTLASLALVYFSVRGEKVLPPQEAKTWKETRNRGEASLHKQAILSPILGILFALGFSLLGFDLVMSLSPHWYSTLFGLYFFVGAFYSALATLMFFSALSVKRFDLGEFIGQGQLRDLGKLLLGFCLVTGDFFFSQFLVIWYGNLPEETRFVITRVNSMPWKPLAWIVLGLCFALPFVVLLSRKAKGRGGPMMLLSVIILVGMWLERFLLVAPSLWKGPGLPLGLSEILISLGFLGLMALSVLWFLNRFPRLPLSDPLFLDGLELNPRGERR